MSTPGGPLFLNFLIRGIFFPHRLQDLVLSAAIASVRSLKIWGGRLPEGRLPEGRLWGGRLLGIRWYVNYTSAGKQFPVSDVTAITQV